MSRAIRWTVRHHGVSMAIGIGLILTGTAILLVRGKQPWWPVAVAVLFPAPPMLALGVVGRSRIVWLAPAALVMTFWCAFFIYAWVQQVLLQFAGHDESCSYVSSSTETEPEGRGTAHYWTVSCPDGLQRFSAGNYPEVNADGLIPFRTVAGGALGAAPASAVTGNYTIWYIALPGIAGTVAVLVAAMMTPRDPGRSLTLDTGEVITLCPGGTPGRRRQT